jgi:hypothetical protein
MNESLAIGFRRRLAAVFAAVFAVLAVSGAWRAAASDEALLLVAVLAFGGISVAYALHAMHRRPVLILDADGLTDLRRGIAVRWGEIEAAHIAERPLSLDPNHELVLRVQGGKQMRLCLDHLTRTWRDLGRIVEARLGSEVSIRREAGGLLSRTRRSLAV